MLINLACWTYKVAKDPVKTVLAFLPSCAKLVLQLAHQTSMCPSQITSWRSCSGDKQNLCCVFTARLKKHAEHKAHIFRMYALLMIIFNRKSPASMYMNSSKPWCEGTYYVEQSKKKNKVPSQLYSIPKELLTSPLHTCSTRSII